MGDFGALLFTIPFIIPLVTVSALAMVVVLDGARKSVSLILSNRGGMFSTILILITGLLVMSVVYASFANIPAIREALFPSNISGYLSLADTASKWIEARVGELLSMIGINPRGG